MRVSADGSGSGHGHSRDRGRDHDHDHGPGPDPRRARAATGGFHSTPSSARHSATAAATWYGLDVRAAMPPTEANTMPPSRYGGSIDYRRSKRANRLSIAVIVEPGRALVVLNHKAASALLLFVERCVLLSDNHRQPHQAATMPDDTIGATKTEAVSSKRFEWRCEVDRRSLPPAWAVVEKRQDCQMEPSWAGQIGEQAHRQPKEKKKYWCQVRYE